MLVASKQCLRAANANEGLQLLHRAEQTLYIHIGIILHFSAYLFCNGCILCVNSPRIYQDYSLALSHPERWNQQDSGKV